MNIIKNGILGATIFSVVILTGCAGVGSIGGNAIPGGLYSSVDLPGDSLSKIGSKTGKACSSSILGWIATGDSTIKTAMKIGGIKEVSNVEYKVNNVLGIYASYCTIVTGS
ncbi:MAG: TRL-like family protein [Thiohalomonadales bacterium]